jgi:tripartite-type tricarboxylate transporter receptor subunit TctC
MLPNTPTVAEAGIKGFSAPNRFGFYAAKDTPAKVIQILTRALEQVLDDPEVRSRLEQQGMLPKYIAPAEFNRQTTEDFQYFSDIVKRSKIRLE